MTATGILAKSSNVGTLMIAQQVGQDAFVDMAKKLGQGVKTGIQLPAETSGRFPAPSTWSVSTFGNLPIGQGVSNTLLELAGMYQAIANNGVRIAPTIVASTTVDGATSPTPTGATTQAMSPANARTLLDMLRGTMQGGDTNHRGTAPAAAITGYQVAGKTGTAQKVDPDTNEYSQTAITSTFAGVVPGRQPQVRHRDHARRSEGQFTGRHHQLRAAVPRHRGLRACVPPTCRRRRPRRRSTTSTCPSPWLIKAGRSSRRVVLPPVAPSAPPASLRPRHPVGATLATILERTGASRLPSVVRPHSAPVNRRFRPAH